MIVNSAVSPFAEERRNAAKADIFLPDGTLLRSFLPGEVLGVSLIREFHKNQKAIPRSEINITFDNRDKYFDITNSESVIYSLEEKCYCESYLSSVIYGSDDSFVRKCRYFYDSFSDEGTSFSLKFTDAVSHSIFTEDNMVQVFNELDVTSARANEILEGVKLQTEYPIEYEVADEISKKGLFYKTGFDNEANDNSIKAGLFRMAATLGVYCSVPVYFMIDDDGKLTFKKQQSEVAATITRKHFISSELKWADDCLISIISDRGNILYQLGDIIEVVDGSKTFKTEIYKIHYKLSNNGSLSSQWEGVVIQ